MKFSDLVMAKLVENQMGCKTCIHAKKLLKLVEEIVEIHNQKILEIEDPNPENYGLEKLTGLELKELRRKKNIPQWKLANLSGVGRHKITLFECNYAEMTDTEKRKIIVAIEKILVGV